MVLHLVVVGSVDGETHTIDILKDDGANQTHHHTSQEEAKDLGGVCMCVCVCVYIICSNVQCVCVNEIVHVIILLLLMRCPLANVGRTLSENNRPVYRQLYRNHYNSFPIENNKFVLLTIYDYYRLHLHCSQQITIAPISSCL